MKPTNLFFLAQFPGITKKSCLHSFAWKNHNHSTDGPASTRHFSLNQDYSWNSSEVCETDYCVDWRLSEKKVSFFRWMRAVFVWIIHLSTVQTHTQQKKNPIWARRAKVTKFGKNTRKFRVAMHGTPSFRWASIYVIRFSLCFNKAFFILPTEYQRPERRRSKATKVHNVDLQVSTQ